MPIIFAPTSTAFFTSSSVRASTNAESPKLCANSKYSSSCPSFNMEQINNIADAPNNYDS